MLPAIVMPMRDPNRVFFPLLHTIHPLLAGLFERAYINVPEGTARTSPDYLTWVESDPFYQVSYYPDDHTVGANFKDLYTLASQACPADQILHLAYIDRVAYALLSQQRPAFEADMRASATSPMPVVYHRSAWAWYTHPQNYYEIESMVTRTGELLFGKAIDYAWCHLALKAADLRAVIPQVTRPDMSMVAELILPLRERLRVKEVDWLAWEDPFILSVDPAVLKAQREGSREETLRRLAYAVPMLELLVTAARADQDGG